MSEDGEANTVAVDQASTDWLGGNVMDDSGLYWFWDPTWDDLYTSASIRQT